ncbi:MAG: DUF6390 family protein [Armatimonadota bacterium]|nr:DUF6390 family protein [Armatimonadota bacterium]
MLSSFDAHAARVGPVGSGVRTGVGTVGALNGALLFARFAFMPNHLGYCGADVNAELLAYLKADTADAGLRRHLRTFTGAYPYLQLIAESNGLADPFDPRVVEAYWIGNDLLEQVDWTLYARHLHERFRGRLKPRTLELLVGKPPAGARAHHAFHVFDVSFRAGLPAGDAALDLCRIGWGTVTAVEPGAFVVSYRPIVVRAGRLAFGEPRAERVLRALGADTVLDGAAVGDVLAFHWRWACMILEPRQAAALERYTTGMLALANQTF